MTNYRRILAPIELNVKGEAIIRRAQDVARAFEAQLVVVNAVHHDCGLESDHVPFLTPQQMLAQIVKDMQQRLEQLLLRVGASGAKGCILPGKPEKVIPAFAQEWRPDLIVLAEGAGYGLQGRHTIFGISSPAKSSWDLLTVQTGGSFTVGKLWRWLMTPV